MKWITSFLIGCSVLFLSGCIDQMYPKPYEKKVKKEHYDVIVVGAEPEGIAAALSAARNGAKVLLLEERDGVGGLFTYGELNFLDIPKNQEGEVVSAGIFKEWHDVLGNPNVFDIDEARDAFMTMLQKEKNITLSLTTSVTDVLKKGDTITSVETVDENGSRTFYAKRFIDATADADVAAMSGATFTKGQEDFGRSDLMGATLMLHLTNVDWEGVKQAASSGLFDKAVATETAAWGFYGIQDAYTEQEEGTNLRGLNIGRTPNGDVYINALQIFGVDGLNDESVKEGFERGERETEHVLRFLQTSFPGFEKARIASIPSELYIRETRHLNALYRVTAKDLLEERVPKDTIAIGGYPVDIQATSQNQLGYIVFNPSHYGIPYRAILPKEVDNLLVTSKASGYDSIPAGSIRVVPTGMAVAEAGGLIAALSVEEEVSLKSMQTPSYMEKIQEQLRAQGAYLDAKDGEDTPFRNDADYESILVMIENGLVSLGYDNTLPLDEAMSNATFLWFLNQMVAQHPRNVTENAQDVIKIASEQPTPFTKKEAEALVFALLETGAAPMVDATDEPLQHRDAYRLLSLLEGGE